MLKNISLLALTGAMLMSTACIIVTDDSGTTDDPSETSGDGDGDATTTAGDGDGDATTGDGDGDGDATTGDGDGDATTTGGGGMCGWNPAEAYYACGFEGEDPDGNNPIACPDGLEEGILCADIGLTFEGCCDAAGVNWFCNLVDGDELVQSDDCNAGG